MAVLLGSGRRISDMTANNSHYLIGWLGVSVIVLAIAVTSILNHRNSAKYRARQPACCCRQLEEDTEAESQDVPG
jgi:cytochrome oxidase assembly protein ShyY1